MNLPPIDTTKAIARAKQIISHYNELLADMDYSAELYSQDHELATAFLEAVKDAERYRWLRNHGHSRRVGRTASMSLGLGPYIRFDPPANNQFSGMALAAEIADAVIDDAMNSLIGGKHDAS